MFKKNPVVASDKLFSRLVTAKLILLLSYPIAYIKLAREVVARVTRYCETSRIIF